MFYVIVYFIDKFVFIGVMEFYDMFCINMCFMFIIYILLFEICVVGY